MIRECLTILRLLKEYQAIVADIQTKGGYECMILGQVR